MALINVDKQFEEIKKAAIDAVKSIFPAQKEKHTLLLNDVWVEDKAEVKDYKSQSKAKEKEGSWGADVYVDLSLKDNKTGKVIDREKRVKLFLLPKMTERGSFIVKGNEYQVANQLRLKSGAYVKSMKGGGVKTFFNLALGKTSELHIDGKGVIRMKVGQANIPLLPLLVGMGIGDQTIQNAWGPELYNQNKASSVTPQVAVKRFSAAFAGSKANDYTTAKETLSRHIQERTSISPEMTALTLGKEHSKFTPQLWLDASKKLIEVEKGDAPADDVDNLAYKEFFGVDDSIKERIEKNKGTLLSKINRNLDSKDKIRLIINIGTFSGLIESFFTEDDRSATPEQINPLHMYSGHEKVTFLGPGAISNIQMASDETRNVHPSHLNFLDAVHTPESEKIGLTLSLAMRTRKVGKDLKSTFIDPTTKKVVEKTPLEVAGKHVAYSDQWDPQTDSFKSNKVKAQIDGEQVIVPASKIDLVMPAPQMAFSVSTNMIPFMASDNGNRTMMAGKHMEQAIPLKNREIPLVQNRLLPGSEPTFEQYMGKQLIAEAPVAGTVTKVTKDQITIKSGKESHTVPLYNEFTLNQKTFMNHEPVVSVGDTVKKGQLIADSNFTKDGVFALGTNLKTAYIPYKGYNFEDGVVITDEAANKLTSEHIHKKSIQVTDRTIFNLSKFIANFPNEIPLENRSKLDDFGVIKKGEKVMTGDIVIAAMKDTGGFFGLEAIKAKFSKSAANRFAARTEVWGNPHPGVVTKVVRSGSTITVYIRTEEPAQIGDKIAGRHGNKGIITKIIPVAQAPHNKEGEPVDVLLNPHGVISRINIGQIYESAMAKAAKKEGKPYKVDNFSGENYLETVKNTLKKAGVSDTEVLIDPETGKELGEVHVGNPYLLKLSKQSEVNFSVRGEGGAVTKTTLQPTSGGEEGTKAIDMLTMYSLLSHGSRENLKEIATYKSENNPDLWEAIKYGKHLPAPKTPFVFDKFVNMMKASGVDIKKDGSKLYLGPLTDQQTKKLSSMEITDPRFYHARKDRLVEEEGGFVDAAKLGGAGGDKWAHIKLKESMPNPIFEDPIKELVGITKDDFGKIVSGSKTLTVDGKEYTGGIAIKKALDKINVEDELKTLKPQLDKLKGTNLNKATKRYRYLTALKSNNLTPSQAYMRDLIPVIPPKFRPISQMESGDLAIDPSNDLYRNVALINKQMNLPVVDMLDDEDLQDVRAELYKQTRALTGLESVKVGGRDKEGFLTAIKGSQPKLGFFQNKVLRKNQNLVGRGTIIPEPQLHMDEVALPEDMAWKLYAPFATKNLIRKGISATDAQKELVSRTPSAQMALNQAMAERPVMLNRAPSLHKFSIMAFRPKITHGKAIKIPPLVVTGFNADFDGDTMVAHVPISDMAVREAYNMMPSRNLYKPGTGALMVGPSQESQLGFYLMTKDPEDRKKLNELLPEKHKIRGELDKRASKELFLALSKELPNEEFSKLIDRIKKMGEEAAYRKGFTLSLKDITVASGRDEVLKELDKSVQAFLDNKIDEKTFNERVTGKNGIQAALDANIKNDLKGTNNALFEMYNSGARGSAGQLRQIVGSPLIVQDPIGKLIPKAIKKSYAEGLDLSDYWVSSFGARKGMIDKALSTQEPGVFNKALMGATMDNVISMEDCKTEEGVYFPVDSEEILGRFIQGNQGGVTDETVIDEAIVKKLKQKNIKNVYVRSPLRCKAPKGTCRHCYGVDEKGHVVNVGDNIGAKAAQSIAEPMTQMVLNTFHTGGVAGSGTQRGSERVEQLLYLPTNIKVGKAVLASLDGKVSGIDKTGLGSFNVYINGVKHTTQTGMALKVKVGSSVKKGDPLTDGVISPRELLDYKGVRETQDFMTKELQNVYHAQGMPVDSKTFETIVRSMANSTQVKNDPLQAPYLPGDIIPWTVAEEYNKNLKLKLPTKEAEGFKLSKSVAGLEKGLQLSSKEIKLLKGLGIEELDVEKDKIEHEPYLRGAKLIPQNKQDWLAQMGATHIQDAVLRGASQGWFSDTKSYHPIPAYALGANFGEGPEGAY